MTKTAFESRFGFARPEVTLANWRQAPFSRWAFHNVSELVPSAVFPASSAKGEGDLLLKAGLLQERVKATDGQHTVSSCLASTHTDSFTVMKSGRFVADWLAPHADAAHPHLVFSISKSLTAILAGILEGEGKLDVSKLVPHYVREAKHSGFADATVRRVLDMMTLIDFEEAYLDPESAFARYRRAMLWNPGSGDETMLQFLCSLPRMAGPYDDVFRYRSPNTDMLGIILERASGERLPDLMRSRLFSPLGLNSAASLTVDREGTGRAAGGVSLTARDLARVGEMMRNGGKAQGAQLVPESWVKDTTTNGDRNAWTKGEFAFLLPEGCYRNQWYQSGRGYFAAIGIHGQWLIVHPASETVIVKLSSQPLPVDDDMDKQNLAFFELLIGMITGQA